MSSWLRVTRGFFCPALSGGSFVLSQAGLLVCPYGVGRPSSLCGSVSCGPVGDCAGRRGFAAPRSLRAPSPLVGGDPGGGAPVVSMLRAPAVVWALAIVLVL